MERTTEIELRTRRFTRRSPGEGTIRHRKDGRWEARLPRDKVNGRRKRLFFYGRTREEAAQKALQARVKRAAGEPIPVGRRTLSTFMKEYLESIKPPMIRKQTWANYELLNRLHIEPALGSTQLTKLEPQGIQALLNSKIRQGLSAQTVHHIRTVLRRALNLALKWRFISYNPATLVEAPRRERPEISPLSADAVRLMLEAAGHTETGAILTVAVRLGLRRGELLGLKWEDINWESRTLSVKRAIQRLKGESLKEVPLKTRGSRRDLALPEELIRTLRAQHTRQLELRLAQGPDWTESGFVFTNIIGKAADPRKLDVRFKRVLKKANLPLTVRLHDLRHTCATLLLEQGADLYEVSRLLGQSSITITADIYGHITPSMKRGLADRIDRMTK